MKDRGAGGSSKGRGATTSRRVVTLTFLLTLGALLCSLFAIAVRTARANTAAQADQHFTKATRILSKYEEQQQQQQQGAGSDEMFAWWHPRAEVQPKYTHDDLLLAITCTHDRLPLLLAGRKWRQKIKTYILMDEPLNATRAPPGLMSGIVANMEYYDYFPTPEGSEKVWSQPGDARAALVAWRANATIGTHQFKWMLYGDDDTLFGVENVLAMVNRLDHQRPYFLADSIWFPEWDGHKDHFVHGSRRAPRCLPCEDSDPLEATGVGWQINEFKALRACPCNLQTLCPAPNGHIINNEHCAFINWRPGMWYFSHGGAGAVLSQGLMHTTTYRAMEDRVLGQRWWTSGDSLFTEAIFTHMGVLPTDPGYGYFRKHVRLFDPGWRENWEGDTVDVGNDPLGVITRLESAVAEDGTCDRECDEQLRHVMTVHVRQWTAPKDVNETVLVQRRLVDPTFAGMHTRLQAAIILTERLSDAMLAYNDHMQHPYRRQPSWAQKWTKYLSGLLLPS